MSDSKCFDCGREYGEQHGFPDLIIENDAWRRISPSGDINGLLCPSCICKRLASAGIRCYGSFMSGPIDAVSPPIMQSIRWCENLREQGHGWICPKCYEGRNKHDDQKANENVA